MTVTEVAGNREEYWDLLLLADPSEDMIRHYLNDGFMLKVQTQQGRTVGEVLTVPAAPNTWEIKNLAVDKMFHHKGYGKALVQAVKEHLPGGTTLLVGTDDVSGNIGFYESCGFSYYRTEPGFFLKNYPEPIMDNGVQCVDMIYLKQIL